MSRAASAAGTPVLRLFSGKKAGGEESGSRKAESGLSSGMTLREFYLAWFLPVLLTAQKRASEKTKEAYSESLDYWEKLSGNPSLGEIDDMALASFVERLSLCTFKRSLCGIAYGLSAATQAKHAKAVQVILDRAGPSLDRRRQGKGLIHEVPHLAIPTPQTDVKDHFTLEEARQIFKYLLDPVQPASWKWQVSRQSLALIIAGAFYTALRRHDLLAAKRSQLITTAEGQRLIVPREKKTGKRLEKGIHPCLAEALEWESGGRKAESGKPAGEEKLFPWKHHYSWLLKLHGRAQLLSGARTKEQGLLSIHAWRRTAATELGLLGLKRGQQMAQQALNHSELKTTLEHYTGNIVEATAIGLLPRLW